MSPAGSVVRAVTIPAYGGPEVLRVSEVPAPAAGAGRVIVHVGAAAVNNADLLLRAGLQKHFVTGLPFPYVPGMDLAGTVHSSTDSRWPVGTRVMAAVSAWRAGGGAQAELVGVPVESLATSPAGLSDVEASTLPMNGLTAMASVDGLGVHAGDTVVVLGAAGAVGGLAIQIAKVRGLHVVAVASAADEHRVRGLGADHVVPRGDGWFDEVRRNVPRGADGVIDAAVLGQPAVDLVRDGGTLATLRSHDQVVMARGVVQRKVFVPEELSNAAALAELTALADSGVITARVARLFTPDEAADAHALLAAGGMRGRAVLDFSPWH
ncbi:zinc-binding dehydrogenase [Rhodococcus qingshengii]|uniref:zinc-binding dehydrogenase n=1 Tax=Rhodococcus qingshengii TaxID=334542 RepID=UPI001F238BEB|nr:zinc-binding dehydrogenase [Rhodococcus qingshengii]